MNPSSTLSRQMCNAVLDVPQCWRAGPCSFAVDAGDTVYSSAQIGIDPQIATLDECGIEVEVRQVIANLRVVAQTTGLTFDLSSMRDSEFY